jgi:hypothetical protein
MLHLLWHNINLVLLPGTSVTNLPTRYLPKAPTSRLQSSLRFLIYKLNFKVLDVKLKEVDQEFK